MKAARSWSNQRIEREESKIASSSVEATRAAYLRAVESGGAVEVVKNGKITRILPTGEILIVGEVAPKVRKANLTYRLEWTPPSRD